MNGGKLYKKLTKLIIIIGVSFLVLSLSISLINAQRKYQYENEKELTLLINNVEEIKNKFQEMSLDFEGYSTNMYVYDFLTNYNNLTVFEKSNLNKMLMLILERYLYITPLVDNISIVSPNMGKVISNKDNNIVDISRDKVLMCKELSGKYKINMFKKDGKLAIINNLNYKDDGDLECYFVVNVNTNYLEKQFSNLQQIIGGTITLYNNSQVLLSIGDGKLDSIEEVSAVRDKNNIVVENSYTIADLGFFNVIWEKNTSKSFAIFKNFIFVIIIILTVFLLIIFICKTYICKIVDKPLEVLKAAFKTVSSGDLAYRIKEENKDDFNFIYNEFNTTINALNKLHTENEEQKLLLVSAELRQLQSQINPHFLYNAFYTLNRLLKMEEYEDTEILSKNLGGYFKYVANNDIEYVALNEEFSHALEYMNIQKMRFKDRVEYTVESVPKQWEDLIVPKMIIQPILENCYKYIFEVDSVEGKINIYFKCSKKFLEIHIEDNGNITDEKIGQIKNYEFCIEKKDMSALCNINRRLQLYQNNNSEVKFTRASIGGLDVVICIDVETSKNIN